MEGLKRGDGVTSSDPESDYYGKMGLFQYRTAGGSITATFEGVAVTLTEKEIIKSKDFKPEEL